MKTSMSVWDLAHVVLFALLALDLIASILQAYLMFRASLPTGSRDEIN